MRAALSCLSLALLAACAAAPETQQQQPQAAAPDPDTICVREARTGSSLPTTKCRTAEQRQAAANAVINIEEQRRNFMGLVTGK
ncbi:MAG TPA: hypothetical protein VIN03_04595 [Roseateles sp.]